MLVETFPDTSLASFAMGPKGLFAKLRHGVRRVAFSPEEQGKSLEIATGTTPNDLGR